MSDAVVVGLIAGGAAVVSTVLSAIATVVAAIHHHRAHDRVAAETKRMVAEIHVSTNGKLNEALTRIAELEEILDGFAKKYEGK